MRSNAQPMDMRTWISQLDCAGELVRIDKLVDPLTQMGSLLYQSREKALLFENLPHGWRSLGQAPANIRHAALAFGTDEKSLVPFVADRLGHRIAPHMVEDAPVKDIKLDHNELDLTTLPVHIAGQRDGGPVIGSGLVVTKDPESGQRNVSFHRLQVKAPNKSGILLYPRHSWKNYVKYQDRNQAMPVAIFIGHHPLYYAAAATSAAYGLDEFEIAGGYLGESVRLTKCETVDLEVPADAELVLEGHIPPHYREEEGPSRNSRTTTSPVREGIRSSSINSCRVDAMRSSRTSRTARRWRDASSTRFRCALRSIADSRTSGAVRTSTT
jgi:2,5-furandicarboxylate decarboxylase 1